MSDPSFDGPRLSMVFWEQPNVSTQSPTISTLKRPRSSSTTLHPLSSRVTLACSLNRLRASEPTDRATDFIALWRTGRLSVVACLQAGHRIRIANSTYWFEGIVSAVEQREGDVSHEELDRRGAIPCRLEASFPVR